MCFVHCDYKEVPENGTLRMFRNSWATSFNHEFGPADACHAETYRAVSFLYRRLVGANLSFWKWLLMWEPLSVCIAAVIRVHILTQRFKSEDLTWNMSQAFICPSVEPNVGIVCACMPNFRPVTRRWLTKWFGGSNAEHGTERPEAILSKRGLLRPSRLHPEGCSKRQI